MIVRFVAQRYNGCHFYCCTKHTLIFVPNTASGFEREKLPGQV